MLNPINKPLLIDMIGNVKHVISIEEHYIIGGLGGILLEIFASNKINNYELTTLGITHRFIHEIKDQNGMRKLFGLSKNSIVTVVKNILGYKIL
jgi:transketolase